jgi:hypothetical protein
MDAAAAYPNRHAHRRSGCFSRLTQRTRPAHATATGALAHVVGATTGTQCLLPACACDGASPLRYSHRLGHVSGSGESLRAESRKEARRSADRAVSSCSVRASRSDSSAASTSVMVAFHLFCQHLWSMLFLLIRQQSFLCTSKAFFFLRSARLAWLEVLSLFLACLLLPFSISLRISWVVAFVSVVAARILYSAYG